MGFPLNFRLPQDVDFSKTVMTSRSGQVVYPWLPESMSLPRRVQLTHATIDNNWEWWQLSPFAQSVNRPVDHSGESRTVIKKMLDCICMRRGMDTVTRLPDHEDGREWWVSPSDDMPTYHVETHELAFGVNKGEVDRLMNEHFKNLQIGHFDSMLTEEEIQSGSELHKDSQGNDNEDRPREGGVSLDVAILRSLTVASMCMLSYKAMINDDTVSMSPVEDTLKDLLLAGEGKNARKTIKEKTMGKGDKVPVLGAEHTEAILNGTGDSGLTYLQVLGINDPFDFVPTERAAVVGRVLARSPLNARITELCATNALEGYRTLVMVATPWEQQ